MSKAFLVSFDDVAFETSYATYNIILSNWRIFSRWFVTVPRMTLKEFHDRPIYNVNELLMKPLGDLNSQQYALIQATILNELSNRYDEIINISEPCKYISERMLSPGFYNNESISKVYVYGKCRDEKMVEMKRKKMQEMYKNKIFEFLPIMPKQTLSDVVGIRGINWEVLYTYNPFDIAEFLVKKTTGKEFMLPYCKTSMVPDNLFKLAMDSDCSIRYYKQD